MNSKSSCFGSRCHILRGACAAILVVSLLIVSLLGCARVPRESVLLSEELTGMIKSARTAHLEMLSAYMAQRRAQADSFMTQKWIPDFMDEYVRESSVLQDLDTAKMNSTKGQIMLSFSEAASDEILKRRIAIADALNEVEQTLRDAIESHYAEMLMVNQALTAHLLSTAKVTETREELLTKLHMKPEEIIPLDKLNPVLERIIRFEATVDKVSGLVDSAKTVIKGEK
jgi:hypothetical protein